MNILRGIDVYAKIISLLFYPSFLQALMASFLITQPNNQWAVWLYFLILPLIFSLVYLRFSKMPKTHQWVVPKEYRIFPLLFALVGTTVFYFFYSNSEPVFVKVITLSSILLTAFALPVTYFWKISLHMIGMGAFTVFMFLYFEFHWFYILFSIAFSQQVAWARMFLKSHDIWQILVGYGLGIVCFLFAYNYYI